MPELGLELVRDVDRERFRSRLPRWDPRLWGDAQFLKNTRLGNRLLKLGLAWGRERVKARKLQQENVTPRSDVAPVSRFTGKEEDVEVGLQYFGKRYLSPYLGRWISPDPLAIHAPGSADLNLFAYVRGGVLRAIDPLGLEPSSVTTMSDFGIPPPRDDNGVPLNAPPVKVIVKLESYVSAADSVRHAASRKANLDLAEKQGNAHGLLGFAGMNSALRPLSPNTTLPPGLQQLAQGTFSEGVQKGSNFNANVTDIAVRVATTPLILAPSAPMTAHIAGATAVWGALGGGAVALGLTAATSTSTGFDYARNLHAAFTGAYVGGILTANAGSIGGEALQLQLRPTFAQLGVRAGSQIAGGVVGYGTETALNGGEFSGLGAVVAGGTSLLGGEVSRGLGGQGFWGDLGSAALGSAASKVADGLTSPQASFTNAQEMHGNF